jgi:tRNA (guanine6-N2)-methyltransferase
VLACSLLARATRTGRAIAVRVATLDLTTHPGLEDLVADELSAVSGAPVTATLRPEGKAGWVRASADLDEQQLLAHADALRSVHRVIRPVAEAEIPDAEPLAWLRAWAAERAGELRELDGPSATFRVRCARSGTHPFTSEDVEREVGAGLRAGRWRPVSLREPDVEVRCDVSGRRARLGVTRPRARSLRHEGPFRPATALRPNLAWALGRLARPGDPPAGELLDPFVGGGAILVEAAALWPGVGLHGSDLQARCVEGTAANLAHAGLAGELRSGDARNLAAVWPDRRFDTVVTDPPFGHRQGSDLDFYTFYRAFLDGAAEVCTPDARLAALVLKRGAFNRALRASGPWEVRHVRVVEVGGLYAGVFVLGLPP